jgi:pilus assembly protein CpaB
LNKNIFKNRMVIGAVCIVLSMIVCFGITPLFNSGLKAQTDIIRVKADISRGDKITDSMIEVISVGAHNLPADVVKSKDEVLGKYAVYDMVSGDNVLSGKLSAEPLTEYEYLTRLDGKNVAVSVTIPSFAAGLSGKLEAGDIITLIAVDGDTGITKTPPELRYVEVLAATASTGSDKVYKGNETSDDEENPEESLPSTLTLLVNTEQAELLADLEANMTFHAALVYRGSRDNAEKFLTVQEQYFSTESEGNGESDDNTEQNPTENTEQNGDESNAE